jgi:hypothetical protein
MAPEEGRGGRWMPPTGDARPERLVVLVPNAFTALPQALAAPLVRLLSDGQPSLVLAEQPDALTRALRERGLGVLTPEEEHLPDLSALRTDYGPRQEFLAARVREDRFLKALPFPGSEAGGNGVFVWDRLQWMLAGRDVRPVLEALPWASLREVVLLGGQPQATMLPTLIASEAHRRRLAVSGWLSGPLMGRWAPLWVHACDRLVVGHREQVEEAARLGMMVATEVAPELDPAPAARPLQLEPGGRRSLLLDLDAAAWHALVRPALSDFLKEAEGAVGELILPVPAAQRVRVSELYGASLAGCPLRAVEGRSLEVYLREPRPVLSFDPYLLWHAAPVVGGVELGVLPAELRAARGGEPTRLLALAACPGRSGEAGEETLA